MVNDSNNYLLSLRDRYDLGLAPLYIRDQLFILLLPQPHRRDIFWRLAGLRSSRMWLANRWSSTFAKHMAKI